MVVMDQSNNAKDLIDNEVSAYYRSPDNGLYMLPSTPQEGVNGVATSVTKVPDIPLETVKEDPEAYVSDNRVFLLGENRYEDSSRLRNRSSQSQTDSKGVVTTKCITCRGEGRLWCLGHDAIAAAEKSAALLTARAGARDLSAIPSI